MSDQTIYARDPEGPTLKRSRRVHHDITVEPKVYLATEPEICVSEMHRFMEDIPTDWWGKCDSVVVDSDLIPEVAGRLCYMSYEKPRPGGNEAYLKHIKEVGHGSVLEHSCFGVILTGVSRSLTHELVRHRAGFGFSELSQRFVYFLDVRFVVPHAIKEEVELAKKELELLRKLKDDAVSAKDILDIWSQRSTKFIVHSGLYFGMEWLAGRESDLEEYRGTINYLLEKTCGSFGEKVVLTTEMKKAVRQAARNCLPNCTETKIFVTANARAWRHFLEQRCSRHAEVEIRIVAGMIWEKLSSASPNLFSDYTKTELPDGTFELDTPYRKV